MPSLVDDIAVEHRPIWDVTLHGFICRVCGFPCICYRVAVAVIDGRGPHARPGARPSHGGDRAPT